MLVTTCNNIIKEIENSIAYLEEKDMNIKNAAEYLELHNLKNNFEKMKKQLEEKDYAINEK